MVHQNDAPLAQGNDVAAADHAAVFAVLIEDGEIAVAHLCHHPQHIGHRGDEGEFEDVVPGHIIGDGGALADELARRVGIHRGGHNGNAGLIGNALDGAAHLGPIADDEQGGFLFNGAELAFVSVAQNDDIPLFHAAFQQLGGGGADLDVAGGADRVGIAHHHGAIQRFKDILVRGTALGQHCGIEHVHVGGGKILHGDDALQLVVRAGDGQGVDLLVAHDLPCAAQAGGARDARHLAVIHVPDLGVHVGAHPGRRDTELFQDELGLLIHFTGTARLTDQRAGAVFELRIGNGGADGIGIGVAVPDDHDLVCFFWHRLFPSLGQIHLPSDRPHAPNHRARLPATF